MIKQAAAKPEDVDAPDLAAFKDLFEDDETPKKKAKKARPEPTTTKKTVKSKPGNRAKASAAKPATRRDMQRPLLIRKPKSVNLKMPQNQRSGTAPIRCEFVNIYTDVKGSNWRVLAHGRRKDKAFSFSGKRITKAESWKHLIQYVNAGKYV